MADCYYYYRVPQWTAKQLADAAKGAEVAVEHLNRVIAQTREVS